MSREYSDRLLHVARPAIDSLPIHEAANQLIDFSQAETAEISREFAVNTSLDGLVVASRLAPDTVASHVRVSAGRLNSFHSASGIEIALPTANKVGGVCISYPMHGAGWMGYRLGLTLEDTVADVDDQIPGGWPYTPREWVGFYLADVLDIIAISK